MHAKAKTVTAQKVELYFEVVDTGIGIPDDWLSQIFLPFSQADASTTRKYGGTGLGLAISKQLVELMGGELAVRGEPHVGSCFSFSLNVKRSVAMGTAQLRQLAELDFDSFGSRPMRVLVAEDDAVNQMVITHMLKQIGYECDVTGNGLEALQALRRQPYDVILMDAQMPEMDGVQATGVIRREWSSEDQPYVIAVTANALRGDRERMIAAGMDDYVSKPISTEELLLALSRAAAVIERNRSSRTGTTTHETAPAKEPTAPNRHVQAASPVDVDLFMERLGEDQHELLNLLLALFMDEAKEVLPFLRQAFDQGDREALWQWAHKLKGSSSGSAAMRFSELCHKILLLAPEQDTSQELSDLIDQLQQEYLELVSWVQNQHSAQSGSAKP